MEFLGNTLSEIALEKSGIFKEGSPVVLAPQDLDVMVVLKDQASRLNCPITVYNEHWTIQKEKETLSFTYKNKHHDVPLPALLGNHQFINLGTALATLHTLHNQFPIPHQAVEQGIVTASWPGRLQKLPSNTAFPDMEIWVDGGHNAAGGEALAAVLEDWKAKDARPMYLIMGMLKRKIMTDFLRPLAPNISKLFAVSVEGYEECHLPQSIVALATELGINGVNANTLEGALRLVNQEPPGRVLICGSLYLVGDTLRKTNFIIE